MRTKIELDHLLHGTPTDEEISDFFKHGEFYEENYLVQAIKKHLITESERKLLFNNDISIEDLLNGRVGDDEITNALFSNWNKKLGFNHFHF